MEKATFAAGCFWGVQAGFDKIEGVEKSTVGYTGGETDCPTYKDVCGGGTGHAEAVELEFDPDIVSYRDLLDAFWAIHDPTQLNRQGPDVGVQYRSAVFYHSPEQEAAARGSKEALGASGRLNGPVVTEVVPAGKFYPAEEDHQKYFEKRGGGGCHI